MQDNVRPDNDRDDLEECCCSPPSAASSPTSGTPPNRTRSITQPSSSADVRSSQREQGALERTLQPAGITPEEPREAESREAEPRSPAQQSSRESDTGRRLHPPVVREHDALEHDALEHDAREHDAREHHEQTSTSTSLASVSSDDAQACQDLGPSENMTHLPADAGATLSPSPLSLLVPEHPRTVDTHAPSPASLSSAPGISSPSADARHHTLPPSTSAPSPDPTMLPPSAPPAHSTPISAAPAVSSSSPTDSPPAPAPRLLVTDTTTHADDADLLMPEHILPLLRCPLCPFATLLETPITLHCGHTVCAKHLRSRASASTVSLLASLLAPASSSTAPATPDPASQPAALTCPLPTCSRSVAGSTDTHVHPASGVDFRPAPASTTPAASMPGGGELASRTDVTVNKILSLAARIRGHLSGHAHDTVDTIRVPDSGDEDSDVEPDNTSIAGPSTPRRSPPGSPSRRPRKRRRLPSPPPAAAPNHRSLSALFEKELMTELTCEICFALLWQPVTTPCQHTFCSKCLMRSMDHSTACPLCRQDLPGYVYAHDQPCNKLVLSILLRAFPAPYAERGELIEAEERDQRLDTPIFVCQLSFPGMPTMLHLFEPRYRLMLRRCLSSPNPSFGMIPPPRPTASASAPGNDFGTMLQIKNVQMLPDGRSVVETWGTWRFRIMERGMLDGYVVARVERVDDFAEEVEEEAAAAAEEGDRMSVEALLGREGGGDRRARSGSGSGSGSAPARERSPSNDDLMRLCHEFLDQLREGTPWVVQHLDRNYVAMPTDPSQFSFWMALLLPIDENEKAKLLPIRSPRLRLRLVVHWIEQLRSHWAFSYASASRWQVVLWWLCRLLIRVFRPGRGRGALAYAAYAVVLAAVVWAQVGMWTREGQVMEQTAVVDIVG